MLSTYNGKKKEKIMKGVSDAIQDRDNLDANAAKAGIYTNELLYKRKIGKSQSVKEDYLLDKNIKFSEVSQIMTDGIYGEISHEEAIQKLDIVFNYLQKHPEKISKMFKERYSELTEDEIIAYFIAGLGTEELERAVKLAYEYREEK